MSPILLREEDPPDDAVVVVRGGLMSSDYVREALRVSYRDIQIYAVSVFLALDQTWEELCGVEPYLARYSQVRISTVGRLRTAAFTLLPTLQRPHYDVLLPDPTDRTLARLEEAFDPPRPNPARAVGG